MGISIERELAVAARKRLLKPLVRRLEVRVPGSIERLDLGAYTKGVAAINRRIVDEKAMQQVAGADGLKLREGSLSIFRPRKAGEAKGTVVLFHGYTAGPWQYEEMATKLHAAGYNVYAPRLPGHGFMTADGVGSGKRLITSTDRAAYDKYIDETFRDAAALGVPVHAAGLSGGGNMALRMAEKYPAVRGIFAMAPYLGGNNPKGALGNLMAFLDKMTFGLLGRVLDHIPTGPNAKVAGQVLPHTQGTIGQVLAARRVGMGVKTVSSPIQFVTTAGDALSGTKSVGRLFERTGGGSRNGWFHFGSEAKVPHAMVSRAQVKSPGAVDQIEKMLLEFLEKGQLTQAGPV